MCKKIQLLVLFLLLCGQVSLSQEFEYGKVTKGELEEKFHPSDTSAPAAILYKKGRSYFKILGLSWALMTEVHCRIKIYKKSGYDYAMPEFSYYTGDGDVVYNFSEAATYNLSADGTIEKTKATEENILIEKVRKYVDSKKLVMPNVSEGSVIEYKYEKATRYFSTFDDWYFQYSIPVNNIEYEVCIPSYFTYRSFLSGEVKINQSEPVDVKTHLFTEARVHYSAKNVSPLKSQPYVNNIDNYMSVLKYELISFDYTKGEFVKHFSTDWQSVTDRLYKSEDFGKQLEFTAYFKKDIDPLLEGVVDTNKKIETIFNYVRSRMTWSGRYGYSCVWGVKDAYKEKLGNPADINLMLVAMLRYAGLKAYPVLISTRSNGFANYPSLALYNYVIAGVETGGKTVTLDATSKHSLPGILPVRALNWTGRMIMENGHAKELDLVPAKKSRESVSISATLNAEGKLTGRLRKQYTDYYAFFFREIYEESCKELYLQRIEKDYNGIEVTGYSLADENDLYKPVLEEYEFSHENISDVIADRIYFRPMLFLGNSENPFTSEKREFPIDFIFPYQKRYTISISLPEGFEAESLPSPTTVALDKGLGSFNYSITASGNQLQLAISFDINYAIIAKEDYSLIKDLFRKAAEKQSEKIVLKRI